jgi:hypothetical protein
VLWAIISPDTSGAHPGTIKVNLKGGFSPAGFLQACTRSMTRLSIAIRSSYGMWPTALLAVWVAFIPWEPLGSHWPTTLRKITQSEHWDPQSTTLWLKGESFPTHTKSVCSLFNIGCHRIFQSPWWVSSGPYPTIRFPWTSQLHLALFPSQLCSFRYTCISLKELSRPRKHSKISIVPSV